MNTTLPFVSVLLANAMVLLPAQQATAPAPETLSRSAFGIQLDGERCVGIGPGYTLRCAQDHVTYVPMLGSAAPRSLPLTIRFVAAGRAGTRIETGSVRRTLEGDRAVVFDRGAIVERCELSARGIEQTFTLARRPDGNGDLIVRCAIESPVAASRAADGSLQFFENGAGVTYGSLLGIDADGRRQAGSVRLVANQIELVLPGEFVDHASYPLVLDPFVGTRELLAAPEDEGQPDLAYDESNQRWLVVRRRVVAFGESQIVGQRIGLLDPVTPVSGSIFAIEDSPGADVGNPRVVDCTLHNTFVVVWGFRQSFLSSISRLHLRAVSAVGSALGLINDAGTLGTLAALAAPHGQDNRVLMVWQDHTGAIRSNAINVLGTAQLGIGGNQNNLTSLSVPTINGNPTISKSGGVGASASFLAVWEQDVAGARDLFGIFLDQNGVPFGSGIPLTNSAAEDRRPAVDGDGTNFLLTWETDAGARLVAQRLRRVGNSVMLVGGQITLDTAPAGQLANADVAALNGPYLATWTRSVSLFDTAARGVAVSASGSLLGSTLDFVGPPRAGNYDRQGAARIGTRFAVGISSTQALVAFEEGQSVLPFDRDIVLQFVEPFGPGGPIVTLAPACGVGGTAGTNGPCSFGNAAFAFTVTNADATAPLCLLSLSPPTTPIPCGTCMLLPPAVLETLPLVNGTASRGLAIPADPGLIGTQLQSQWLPLFGGSTPCPLFSFFSASSLLQVEVGI